MQTNSNGKRAGPPMGSRADLVARRRAGAERAGLDAILSLGENQADLSAVVRHLMAARAAMKQARLELDAAEVIAQVAKARAVEGERAARHITAVVSGLEPEMETPPAVTTRVAELGA